MQLLRMVCDGVTSGSWIRVHNHEKRLFFRRRLAQPKHRRRAAGARCDDELNSAQKAATKVTRPKGRARDWLLVAVTRIERVTRGL